MPQQGLMWECSCGHIEYGEIEPDDCLKCGNLSTFVQMPEEIIEEREKDLIEENQEHIMKQKKSKSKIPVKKNGRKK